MHAVATFVLCVLAAVVYGVVHDQITARVCVEYFTIGHPPIFGTDDPTVLGLGWGVIATWWVGAILGVLLVAAARVGSRPRRSAGSLVRPVVLLMLALATLALGAGVLGRLLADVGAVVLIGPMAADVPPAKHAPFLSVMWAHSASYLFGFLGGSLVCVRVWRSRKLSVAD